MKTPIYLDNHATTRMDPRVLDAMLPYFTEYFGNAASRNHEFGWEAEQAVDKARKQIADLIGATPRKSSSPAAPPNRTTSRSRAWPRCMPKRATTSSRPATEHKAVLDTCKKLEKHGCRVTYLPVKRTVSIDLDMLRDAITDKTILVTIMYANNEIGVMQPIAEIGKICRRRAFSSTPTAYRRSAKFRSTSIKDNIDLMSITAHKMYGPKGVGALYVRRKNPRVQLTAQMDGGGHERGMRSGTLNVPGIVGLGEACAICQREMAEESKRLRYLRDKLKEQARSADSMRSIINGSMEHRLPHNLNLSFAYVEGESLLMGINEVAVSSGSACTSATLEPSYVLKALGVGRRYRALARSASASAVSTRKKRSITWPTSLIEVVRKLRELSPLYEMAKEGIDLKTCPGS